MKQWYVVHCRVNSEQRAETNLRRQDYETWLPMYRKTRRHARMLESVLRPLFPRYLFVRLDLTNQQWRPILSTFGVYTIVAGAEGPLAIGDEIIEALRTRTGSDGIFEIARSVINPGADGVANEIDIVKLMLSGHCGGFTATPCAAQLSCSER